jgi:hypothetical protein
MFAVTPCCHNGLFEELELRGGINGTGKMANSISKLHNTGGWWYKIKYNRFTDGMVNLLVLKMQWRIIDSLLREEFLYPLLTSPINPSIF